MGERQRNAIEAAVIALAVEAVVGLVIFALWFMYVAHVSFD